MCSCVTLSGRQQLSCVSWRLQAWHQPAPKITAIMRHASGSECHVTVLACCLLAIILSSEIPHVHCLNDISLRTQCTDSAVASTARTALLACAGCGNLLQRRPGSNDHHGLPPSSGRRLGRCDHHHPTADSNDAGEIVYEPCLARRRARQPASPLAHLARPLSFARQHWLPARSFHFSTPTRSFHAHPSFPST
jgi:hypothetical protein